MTKKFPKQAIRFLIVLALLLTTATMALAQELPQLERAERANPSTVSVDLQGLKLDKPATVSADELLKYYTPMYLGGRSGPQRVVIQLAEPAAAVAQGAGVAPGAAVQAAATQQDQFVAGAKALDANAKVLGSLKLALNAVIMEIDAAALRELAANPNVISIRPVKDYELDLSETVPYIGATAVQDMGYDGSGIRVAVLDSGIDYTHAALGGSGDPADYANNDPTIIEPGTFPTAKVVGGYDFTGSVWPNGAEAPDPDPLDDGPEAGHGTHVAHIIGGVGGVAPGVDLYAVKVCSSVSTSCSGIALLQAMDFALDPNGDGDMSDRMHVVNMSLGSNYGDSRWDDLSQAVENASAVGVLTVASAGNGADKPYVTGTPSAAPSALSVAQTAVPSAVQGVMEVTEPASIAGQYAAVFQPWSTPLEDVGTQEGPLQYGDGAGGNLDGCAAFPADSLTGKIVLVDRGNCTFSSKIYNVQLGGGLVGIIGLIAPGDPFEGGFGGGGPFTIPGYMISQADANRLRAGLATGNDVNVVFDPANGIPLVMHMVGSSSRGPAFGTNLSKPDIGAPGASVSAEAGTGTGETPFGGTSGAAPMVSGSAALLMQAYPDRSWAEIKAVLMNTGETDIMNKPELFGGGLAPISRIGGGEVRVDQALESPLAAWDDRDLTGSLSFGFHDVPGEQTIVKRVRIRNYSNREITIRTDVSRRFPDGDGNEVRLGLPSVFTVPRNRSITIPVTLFIRPRDSRPLHDWAMNGGSNGANANALTFNEYDGYISFTDLSNPDNAIHMPWHVLPRGAGDIQTGQQLTGVNFVRNAGKSASFIDTYSLIGESPELPPFPPGGNIYVPDLKYIGVQTYPVPAGFCSDVPSFVMGFAVNTWQRQTMPNTTAFEFDLDTDPSVPGPEYAVLNFDLVFGTLSDGRNVTWVIDLATGEATAFFFTQHYTNSANTVLDICGEQIGMNAEDFFVTSMDADVFGVDIYYSGLADFVGGINIVPLGERYFTVFENGDFGYTVLGPGERTAFGVIDFGDQLNLTENGLLWLYGPGAPANNEARAWILQP